MLEALESSGLADALRANFWTAVWLEILHYFGIMLWLGSVLMLDFRLLGLSSKVPVRAFNLAAGAWAGLALTLVTGLLMFTMLATGYVQNPAFWVKIVLLVLATATGVVFHQRHVADASGWASQGPPMSARIAGATSLVLWVGALFAGRMITYWGPTQG